MARTIGEKLDDLLDRQTNAYLDSTVERKKKVCPKCDGNGTGEVEAADSGEGK